MLTHLALLSCAQYHLIIELVLVLGHPIFDWDYVLAHPIGQMGCPVLAAMAKCMVAAPPAKWDQSPLDNQLVQVDIQPGFLLWAQVGWLHPDGYCVG